MISTPLSLWEEHLHTPDFISAALNLLLKPTQVYSLAQHLLQILNWNEIKLAVTYTMTLKLSVNCILMKLFQILIHQQKELP